MTNQPSQYSDDSTSLYEVHQLAKKGSKLKHRAMLHGLVGLLCFGFFMGTFSQFENSFKLFSTTEDEPTLYSIPQTSNLRQQHGTSIYDIAGNAAKKTIEINVNRLNKRHSTFFVKAPIFTSEELAQKAARRAKQVAELDRQAALRAVAQKAEQQKLQDAANSDRFSNDKIADNAGSDDKKLLASNSISPKILSAAEMKQLREDSENQADINLSEQSAPMPNIHSGADKSQFVEAMLARVTAQAHDTEVGWSAGSGKTSSIRRQTVSLDKLNGFSVVDGKIATKQDAKLTDRILLANVKVPAPLKRPKYIPKPKAQTPATSRSSLTCLTTALYHEVRGESRAGQLAVAEVIAARVRSRSYPKSYCGVIYQNATKRNRCQFSFACDGKTDLPRDLKTWQKMKKLAGDFLAGRASSPKVRGATHYHTKAVSPKWRWAMKRIATIGAHIFYKDPKAKA